MKGYPNFPAWELKCKCGKCREIDGDMSDAFMQRLGALREELGPLPLTSAYRCPAHNKSVSSTGLNGPHTTGEAVDISCTNGLRRKQIIAAALQHGFNRIGVAKNFVHIDSLTEAKGFSEHVLWTY
jgi:uncharacterized protein YcbK (DUF882 family)